MNNINISFYCFYLRILLLQLYNPSREEDCALVQLFDYLCARYNYFPLTLSKYTRYAFPLSVSRSRL